MKEILRRSTALLLALIFIVGLVPGASAAGYPAHNDGVRHQVCTQLSNQAKAYYTGSDSWENLKTMNGVATDSSLAAMDGQLYKELQRLMDQTMTDGVSYKKLTSYWPYTDSQKGSNEAVLFYSDIVEGGYNREHVWPKSRASFYQTRGGSDLHHLRPTDAAVNSTRSNYTMGNVRDLTSNYKTMSHGGHTVLYYDTSRDLVEVNDNIKGDVARVMLYVYTRWGEPNLTENVSGPNLPQHGSDKGGNNGLKVMYDLDTLLNWCEIDPVDDWEMTRNDRVQDVQHNRNVFIDYPELAWMLFDREIPQGMTTPSGEGDEMSGPKFQVTVGSNNAAWGTASADGYKITAVPAKGYEAVSAAVTPAGAANVTRNGNVFALSGVKQDVTVTITFGPKTEAHIQYVLPQGVTAVNPTTKAYLADEITLPQVTGTPADSSRSYTFAGWTQAPVEDTTTEVTCTQAGSKYTVSDSSTVLYALYTYAEEGQGNANVFEKVTQVPASWAGEYVMTGGANMDERVHKNDAANVGEADCAVLMTGTGMTLSGSTLSNVTEDYVIVVAPQGDGSYSMQMKKGGQYLSYNKSGNSLGVSDVADAKASWKFTVKGAGIVITNVGSPDRILQYNSSAKMFRCYTGSQKTVNLYSSSGAVLTHYLTLGEKKECPHSQTELKNVKEATCTEAGYTGDQVCTVCGETVKTGEVIPALGHEWGQWIVIEAPAVDRKGLERRECSRCHEIQEQEIPALNGPKYEDFTDLEADRWYTDGVDYVINQGIMDGMAPGVFKPDGRITRGQMVTILYRLMGEPEVDGNNPFTDVAENRFYYKPIIWAVQEGITNGVTDTTFAPEKSMTREQMATFFFRYETCLNGAPEVEGNLDVYPDADDVSRFAVIPMTWAAEQGYITGMEGRLNPQGTATRAQCATVIYRNIAR